MLEDWRGYLQLASGLTEVTARKARDVAASLLSRSPDLDALVPEGMIPEGSAARVQDLADELVATSKANRELLMGVIRTEVDRAVGRLGFVREEELAAVRAHVARLEDQLAEATPAAKKAAKKTARKVARKSVKKAAKKPVKRPVKKPVEKAVEKAASGPIGKPRPTEKSAETTSETSAEKPVAPMVAQPTKPVEAIKPDEPAAQVAVEIPKPPVINPATEVNS